MSEEVKGAQIPDVDKFGVLYRFLETLSEEDKEKFIKAHSDEELALMSSSREEYRIITGEEAPDSLHLPEKGRDVRFSKVTTEQLEERMEEINETFPSVKSLSAIRKKAEAEDRPGLSINISLDFLKRKSLGQNEEDMFLT